MHLVCCVSLSDLGCVAESNLPYEQEDLVVPLFEIWNHTIEWTFLSEYVPDMSIDR